MNTIVYLDQNYISNMAKARFGLIKNKDENRFWNSLFNDLQRAVLANKIACPESEFHITEARFDKRLEGLILEVIKILTGGLQLYPWKSILESQVKDAARRFLGKQPEERESWSVAFLSDPHSKYTDRTRGVWKDSGRMWIHAPLTQNDIDHDRQLKEGFSKQAKTMLEEYSSRPLEWPELLLESKKSVISGFMGKYVEKSIYEKLAGDYPFEDKSIAVANYIRLKHLWDCIHLIGIDPKDYDIVNKFVRSTELLDSPFIDINASIQAAIAESYIQGREPRKGDFYDVPILSSILPYCDIITTDRFMKGILVDRLQFDAKYGVTVFSASQPDGLAFQGLIQEIAK